MVSAARADLAALAGVLGARTGRRAPRNAWPPAIIGISALSRRTQLRFPGSGAGEAPDDFSYRRCQLAISYRDLRPQTEAPFCQRCTLPARFGRERSCGRCAVTDVINEDEGRLARLKGLTYAAGK